MSLSFFITLSLTPSQFIYFLLKENVKIYSVLHTSQYNSNYVNNSREYSSIKHFAFYYSFTLSGDDLQVISSLFDSMLSLVFLVQKILIFIFHFIKSKKKKKQKYFCSALRNHIRGNSFPHCNMFSFT